MSFSEEYELALLGLAAATASKVLAVVEAAEKAEVEKAEAEKAEAEKENLKRKSQTSDWVEKSKIWRANQDCTTATLSEDERKLQDKMAFRIFIRMDEEIFEALLPALENDLEPQDTHIWQVVTGRQKFAVTLHFLSTGESFEKLELQTGLSKAFLSEEIPKVCNVLWKKFVGKHVKLPSSQTEWDNIARKFLLHWNFPLCIGAVGFKHIAFKASKDYGCYFRNLKGFDSIILLAMTDANCRFTYLNIGCNGYTKDSEVLYNANLVDFIERQGKNLKLEKMIGNGRLLPYVIIAGNAIALRKRVMKPYPYKSSEDKKKIFGCRLNRARQTVQHALEVLTNRFRVLQTTIDLNLDKIDSIIKASCVLYNILVDVKETEMIRAVNSIFENQSDTSRVIFGELMNKVSDINFNYKERNANQIRDEFAEYFSNEGKL